MWNECLFHYDVNLYVFAADVTIRVVVSWRMAPCYNLQNYNLNSPTHCQIPDVLDCSHQAHFLSCSHYMPHASPETRSSYFRRVDADYVLSRHRTAQTTTVAAVTMLNGSVEGYWESMTGAMYVSCPRLYFTLLSIFRARSQTSDIVLMTNM